MEHDDMDVDGVQPPPSPPPPAANIWRGQLSPMHVVLRELGEDQGNVPPLRGGFKSVSDGSLSLGSDFNDLLRLQSQSTATSFSSSASHFLSSGGSSRGEREQFAALTSVGRCRSAESGIAQFRHSYAHEHGSAPTPAHQHSFGFSRSAEALSIPPSFAVSQHGPEASSAPEPVPGGFSSTFLSQVQQKLLQPHARVQPHEGGRSQGHGHHAAPAQQGSVFGSQGNVHDPQPPVEHQGLEGRSIAVPEVPQAQPQARRQYQQYQHHRREQFQQQSLLERRMVQQRHEDEEREQRAKVEFSHHMLAKHSQELQMQMQHQQQLQQQHQQQQQHQLQHQQQLEQQQQHLQLQQQLQQLQQQQQQQQFRPQPQPQPQQPQPQPLLGKKPSGGPKLATDRALSLKVSPPLELLWYADRHYPVCGVEVVGTGSQQPHTDTLGWAVQVFLLDGFGADVSGHLSGQVVAENYLFAVHHGSASISGIRFSRVSSKCGGHFRLVFAVVQPEAARGLVNPFVSEPLQVLSYRLYHTPKVPFEKLQPSDPVSRMKGIGNLYASRLASLGIHRVDQLAAIDINSLGSEGCRKLVDALRKDRGALTMTKLAAYIEQAREIILRAEEDAPME